MAKRLVNYTLDFSTDWDKKIAFKRRGRKIAIGAIIAVIIVAVILFLPYKGLPNLLGLPEIGIGGGPYYRVNSIQQLSLAAETLSNSSGPFNVSYSSLLQFVSSGGPVRATFSFPVNGFIAYYAPFAMQKADFSIIQPLELLYSLVNKSLPYIPSTLDILNVSTLSNSTGEYICIPFLTLAKISNQSAQSAGLPFNDTSATNSSLICTTAQIKDSTFNYTSLVGLLLPSLDLNSQAISRLDNSLNVEFEKDTVYKGEPCSIIDINTSDAFEAEYNESFGFSLCFSNRYGVPLYGSFTINMTKYAGVISSFLNSSGIDYPFSSLILTGNLSSSLEKPPLSQSSLSSMPAGSYSMNVLGLQSLISSASAIGPSGAIAQAPAALSSYVKTYLPNLVFSPAGSYIRSHNGSYYSSYVFESPALTLANATINTPGIRVVFSLSPAYGETLSELNTSVPNPRKVSIEGYPGIAGYYAVDGNIAAAVIANGNLYYMFGYTVGSSYIAELNSSSSSILNNFRPSYLSCGIIAYGYVFYAC